MLVIALTLAGCFNTVAGDDKPVDTGDTAVDTATDTDSAADTDTDTDSDTDTDTDSDTDTDTDSDTDTDTDTDTDVGPGVAPAVGDLVISELMFNPDPIADEIAEWFEVHNTSASAVELQGVELADLGTNSHVIASSLVVPAGGYVVIGRSADTSANGGIPVGYVYDDTFAMSNSGDEIVLRLDGVVLDQMEYVDNASAKGVSIVARTLSASANDTAADWCPASSPTPGAANAACASAR